MTSESHMNPAATLNLDDHDSSVRLPAAAKADTEPDFFVRGSFHALSEIGDERAWPWTKTELLLQEFETGFHAAIEDAKRVVALEPE